MKDIVNVREVQAAQREEAQAYDRVYGIYFDRFQHLSACMSALEAKRKAKAEVLIDYNVVIK